MSRAPGGWTATIRIRRPDPTSAERLERSLAPEAGREVPRSRARLRRWSDREIVLEVETEDAGALRAAINAYLGWIRLAIESESVARAPRGGPGPPA